MEFTFLWLAGLTLTALALVYSVWLKPPAPVEYAPPALPPVKEEPSLPLIGRDALMTVINRAIVAQAEYEVAHGERQQTRLAAAAMRHDLRTAKLPNGERRPVGHYDFDQRLKSVELRVRAECAEVGVGLPANFVEILAERLEEAYAA